MRFGTSTPSRAFSPTATKAEPFNARPVSIVRKPSPSQLPQRGRLESTDTGRIDEAGVLFNFRKSLLLLLLLVTAASASAVDRSGVHWTFPDPKENAALTAAAASNSPPPV